MPRPLRFTASKLLYNGDWGEVNRPAIKEFFPVGNEKEDNLTFDLLFDYRRVIVLQLITRSLSDVGFSRRHEGASSADIFAYWVQARTFEKAQEIFDKMRRIYLDIDPTGEYSHFDFDQLQYTAMIDSWRGSGQLRGYRTGKTIVELVAT